MFGLRCRRGGIVLTRVRGRFWFGLRIRFRVVTVRSRCRIVIALGRMGRKLIRLRWSIRLRGRLRRVFSVLPWRRRLMRTRGRSSTLIFLMVLRRHTLVTRGRRPKKICRILFARRLRGGKGIVPRLGRRRTTCKKSGSLGKSAPTTSPLVSVSVAPSAGT